MEGMAKDQGCSVQDLMADEKKRQDTALGKYVTDKVGLPTLQDILAKYLPSKSILRHPYLSAIDSSFFLP